MKKIKLNLNFKPKTSDGRVSEKSDDMSKFIGEALMEIKSANPQKIYEIASDIMKDGNIEMYPTTLQMLKNEIKTNKGIRLNNLILGQLFEYFDKAEKEAEEEVENKEKEENGKEN